MAALALALALAWGPTDFEEDRLPRALAESFVPAAAAPDHEGHEILVGAHFGAVEAYDGKGPSFLAGLEWRIHILPWLGVGATFDYHSRQHVDAAATAGFLQVPLMWSFLLYPPLDLGPLRLYGQVGGGFTITDISGTDLRNDTDLNWLFCLGFGAEIELSSNVMLDANLRLILAQEPSGTGDFRSDWAQVSIGLLFKLPR